MASGIKRSGALIAVAGLGLGLGWLTGSHSVLWSADEPPVRAPGDQARPENVETVSGKVRELLRNDRGDVDGLLMEDGKKLHFPPHEGEAVAKLVKVGDEIKVWANRETRPRGEVVLEMSRLENRGETLTIDRPAPPPGGGPGRRNPPPAGPGARFNREEAMNANGKIREFTSNRHGDVDGLVLDDGTEVKLPPHQGRDLQDLVRRGDEVRVEGRRHETPRGDIHLHADRITAVVSNRSLERDGPGRPGHVPPHERDRGPREGGPGARPAPPPHEQQFDQILRELKEIRRLLEAQQSKP